MRDETITIRADLGGGAEGYLVIDTSVASSATGGVRAVPELTLAEVAALAREMTLKFAFAGRDAGGAKSGIRLPRGASPEDRRGWIRELGRRLGPLVRRGVYWPATDVGCGCDDLPAFFEGAGLPSATATDTALFTAIGGCDALAACRETLGAPARPLRVAIEGLGAVATHLVRRLPADRWVIAAVSTVEGTVARERGFPAAELARARARFGDALVHHLEGDRADHDALFSADVDVLVPAARTWSVTPARARALRARAVVPMANAPYADGAVPVLEARGIVCLPGFVTSCGGVALSALHGAGVPLPAVEDVSARHLRAVVRALLGVRAHGASPLRVAEEVALDRLARRDPRAVLVPPWRRAATVLAGQAVPRRLRARRHLARLTRHLAEVARLVEERGRLAPPARSTGT